MSKTKLDTLSCGCEIWTGLDAVGDTYPEIDYCKKHELRQITELRSENNRLCDLLAERYETYLRSCAIVSELAELRADLAAKDKLLLEMFQALAGVLGDIEHRGIIRPVVHKACETAVCHWLAVTQPEADK